MEALLELISKSKVATAIPSSFNLQTSKRAPFKGFCLLCDNCKAASPPWSGHQARLDSVFTFHRYVADVGWPPGASLLLLD
ncbi:hypothetical protein L195_g011254 [Trifolium pratense]|uniref:Uncharacterized protein n=1 Tax=Trifolium pratense TaxID=57577 RepID=A0A2K3PH19_TRIPR|nr:hypothetical protein L195_g011254 [Trifolium pratense]